MNFHDFYQNRLNPTEDGVHKECRAKDPDNCRKCHTGRFATGIAPKGDTPKAKPNGGSATEEAKREPWKVFKRGKKELFAYTVRGEGAEEEQVTKQQLADELGCRAEEIDVIKEDRPSIKGKVPGEKEPPKTEPGGEGAPKTVSPEKLEKTAKVIAAALHELVSDRD